MITKNWRSSWLSGVWRLQQWICDFRADCVTDYGYRRLIGSVKRSFRHLLQRSKNHAGCSCRDSGEVHGIFEGDSGGYGESLCENIWGKYRDWCDGYNGKCRPSLQDLLISWRLQRKFMMPWWRDYRIVGVRLRTIRGYHSRELLIPDIGY